MAAKQRQLLSEKQILNFIEELDSDDIEETEDSTDDSENYKLLYDIFLLSFSFWGPPVKWIWLVFRISNFSVKTFYFFNFWILKVKIQCLHVSKPIIFAWYLFRGTFL